MSMAIFWVRHRGQTVNKHLDYRSILPVEGPTALRPVVLAFLLHFDAKTVDGSPASSLQRTCFSDMFLLAFLAR